MGFSCCFLLAAASPRSYRSHQAAVRRLRSVSLTASAALAKKIMTVLNDFITVNCRLRSVNTGGATHLAFNCIQASRNNALEQDLAPAPLLPRLSSQRGFSSSPPEGSEARGPQPGPPSALLWAAFWGRQFLTRFWKGRGSRRVRAEPGMPALGKTGRSAFCTRF